MVARTSLAIVLVASGSAVADPQKPESPQSESQASSLGGLRHDLASHGVQLTFTYYGDLLGNPSGGVKTGAIYEGRAGLLVDLDLDKLVGWTGGTFHTSVHQIHGKGLSTTDVNNLMTISGIEAEPTTRLFNLWLEQSFGDALALRAGKVTAAQEIFVSTTANLFVNSTFGWPTVLAADLPSGGPAYPLATLGARAKLVPMKGLTMLAAIFNGDPAGPGGGDPQQRDDHGLNSFRISGRPLAMIEASYAGVKVGLWQHFASFADLRFDTNGASLADPASTGQPARHDGDHGAYLIVDRTLGWSLDGFIRAALCPSDENMIDRYIDAGISRSGMFRAGDSTGLAVAFARISPAASALDRDQITFTGMGAPIRDYEALVELTYQATINQDWSVQPDLQYVFHPGGSSAIANAFVIGIRTFVRI
jgi:porin